METEINQYTSRHPVVKKRMHFIVTRTILILLITFQSTITFGYVNSIKQIGFSLIPAPQQTKLTGQTINFGTNWSIVSELENKSIILKSLQNGFAQLHEINFSDEGKNKIILEIKPNSINNNLSPELAKQAYQLEIKQGIIKITGNNEAGLFYGVQSILQLIKQKYSGSFSLPEGVITDWPDLELRIMHWDTKHHQDRIATLKRYIDQAAYFKFNAVAFEMEDKYEFQSHPIIGAPGAYTKAEMHEITAYAKERFIQLIPMVQAPSHMSYVLKHEEFAHLKADNNNYNICMCDEEAIQLIFDLYQDMIDASPGVDYFLVSTDEMYFAGICDKCEDEFNDKNRSQAWVDFANKANEFMQKHGRKMISWIEFPLLPEDIHKLPSTMIDGVINSGKDQAWIDEENKAGIRQLNYNSIQGSEFLFPNYFPTEYRYKKIEGNLRSTSISSAKVIDKGANLMGSFTAAWDDSGLHNELFWLGWASGVQYSWSVGKPSVEQSTADFMDAFYGYNNTDMVEIYRILEDGARFYQNLWDNVISKERAPGYGDSFGKGKNTKRYDLTFETLPIPNINSEKKFSTKYADKIESAVTCKRDNEKVISLLMNNFSRVEKNHYNLEVLLAIAYLEQYTINTLFNWVKIENYLNQASLANDDYSKAIKNLVEAYNLASEILKSEEKTGENLKTVWEKSRFEKCRTVDGKEFVHVLDDLKDHFADRRTTIKHMLAPFERMEIEKWQSQLMEVIEDFAKTHDVTITGLLEKPLNE